MTRLVLPAAMTLAVAGMMLVIAGVLVRGAFLPGVALIGAGLLGFAAAAITGMVAAHRAGSAG
jgi:hypothetical protein